MLDFIYSQKKKEEIENILHSTHPGHSERLFLTGFLYNCCNLSGKDILRLIQYHSRWLDFDVVEATKHINSICKGFPAPSFSEDFSFANHKDDAPQYRRCQDTSIFSKLNHNFFDKSKTVGWEYHVGMYNLNGKMNWSPLSHPIYRGTENIDNSLMFFVDIDGTDLYLCWYVAKQIYNIDDWSTFKFSGSRGFHLAKATKNKSYSDLREELSDIYSSVQTNLISYTKNKYTQKPVNIDPSSVNRNHLIRGFCVNLKSNKYSIPVNEDQTIEEILDISSNINKVEQYLKS